MATSPEVGHLLDIYTQKHLQTRQQAENAYVGLAVDPRRQTAASSEKWTERPQRGPSVVPEATAAPYQCRGLVVVTLKEQIQKVNKGPDSQGAPAIACAFGILNREAVRAAAYPRADSFLLVTAIRGWGAPKAWEVTEEKWSLHPLLGRASGSL